MSEPQLNMVARTHRTSLSISFEEKLADHNAIVGQYIRTLVTRNFTADYIRKIESALCDWYEGIAVSDPALPSGERQLFLWELMAPTTGRQYVQAYSQGMVLDGVSRRTILGNLGILRRFCEYVLQWPYIPGCSTITVSMKYGSIVQPVLRDDYPVNFEENILFTGYVLLGKELQDFYRLLHEQYIPQHSNLHMALRNYTMIVIARETAFRADEIRNLNAEGRYRDIFYDDNKIQTRHAKGFRGSGKRTRTVELSQFARDTLRYYEEKMRPLLLNNKRSDALFLNAKGERITYGGMKKFFPRVVRFLRSAGLESLPEDLSWHDMRRSWATDFAQKHPHRIYELRDKLGHLNLGTLSNYVIVGEDYLTQSMNKIIEEMIGPS